MSGESAWHWRKHIDSQFHVVPNPVAPEWFEIPLASARATERILWANHREKPPRGLLIAAESRDCEVLTCYKQELGPMQIMELVGTVGLVIGTGRWIYEAMAAGRHAIVGTHDRCCGYVRRSNYLALREYNMTTRSSLAIRTDRARRWDRMLGAGLPSHPNPQLREIARRHHHVGNIVDQLLEIAA